MSTDEQSKRLSPRRHDANEQSRLLAIPDLEQLGRWLDFSYNLYSKFSLNIYCNPYAALCNANAIETI